MRLKGIAFLLIGSFLAALAGVWLNLQMSDALHLRPQRQFPILFSLGLILALIFGIWPVGRLFSGGAKLLVRSIVFTLFLAPVPFGPEGAFMPAIITVFFAPQILILMAPLLLLSFLCVFGAVLFAEGVGVLMRRGGAKEKVQSENLGEKGRDAEQPL